MSKKTIGISIALLGAIILFSSEENAWIISAIFLGFGSGIFFWKK
jgi:multisubunit Na+/H+ antiporter MnhG subunit|tara:strand:+ start:499 stop:633 length:135 start_codon:yes stop_codon:yes gene_type:complete